MRNYIVKTIEYENNKKKTMISRVNVYFFIKRLIDIIGASAGLLLTIPVFVLVTLFYLGGDSKGPIFFKQTRIGREGKKFNIIKFRSMVINADKKLKNNHELYQKYINNNYKLEPNEDPRITKLGQFLRRTSLDELPQLINVLKGEMSLVGPRPVVEEELLEYGDMEKEFLSVKPGLTGYWQVSGRSDVGYPERVDIEIFYVNNYSLKLDISIIIKTILIVIKKEGAY